MQKARLCLTAMITMIGMLSFALPAFAWVHGNFSATTDGCAGCHIAHAASASRLLLGGTQQTRFCFLCHGQGTINAPYDVQTGKTYTGYASVGRDQLAIVGPSTAGGFEAQYFKENGNEFTRPVTSRHNVRGMVNDDLRSSPATMDDTYRFAFIPGSTYRYYTPAPNTQDPDADGFRCCSCHDPHAGGKTPDPVTGNVVQPRLLRSSITIDGPNSGQTANAGNNLTVIFKMASPGAWTSTQGSVSGVYRVTQYVYGSSNWCGACHNKFNDFNNDGHASNVNGFYRHPTYTHIITEPKNATLETGTPLEISTPIEILPIKAMNRRVACLSCHRAHSTTAVAEGWASNFPRSETGPGQRPCTSALLRMDNRGICWNCHDAGKVNCWSDSNMKCDTCH